MNITEIRVKLTMDPRNKLRGYCSVTLDNAFVVRDLKIIDGAKATMAAADRPRSGSARKNVEPLPDMHTSG